MSKDQKQLRCPIAGERWSTTWCILLMCVPRKSMDVHSLHHHLDINDIFIYVSGSAFSTLWSPISNCQQNVCTWMSQRHLKLSAPNPELMIHTLSLSLRCVPLPAPSASQSPVVSVRVMGIFLAIPPPSSPCSVMMSNLLGPQSV